MTGWYLMHRGWMESPDFKRENFTEREAYLWSVEQAAHSPHRQWFNGSQYAVDRGEFVTSLHIMADTFGWSLKRVRGFKQRMRKAQKWAMRGAYQGAKAPTILTVCNYAVYQTPAKAEGKAEGNANGNGGAKQGQSEGKEQNELLNNGNEFEGMREGAAVPARAVAQPYDEAIAMWSQAAAIKGWKPVTPNLPLSDKRRTGLGKVLKAFGLEGWRDGLQRAVDSQWLGGPDPPDWFNLSFVCNLDNFTKLYEGNYDRSFSQTGSKQQQSSPWLDAHHQLSA